MSNLVTIERRSRRIVRVFPRITKATPQDDLAFFDEPPLLFPVEADEVHVSCTFTADKPRAEYLADQWHATGIPVRVGGVAYGDPGLEFVPGRYVKHGYTFTSRGCPRAEKHRPAVEWKKFQRRWARPTIIHATRHGSGQ